MREYNADENSWRSSTQILGSYLKFKGQSVGYFSPIFLVAKFGAPTRISEANFGGKFCGQAPPQPPDMEVPPGNIRH